MNRVDQANPHLGGNIVGPTGDPNTYYPELWKWLVSRYDVKSVLDVGCGAGHSSEFFNSLGCSTLGIDGLLDNISDLSSKGIPCVMHDYTAGPANLSKVDMFDLCWCCEFVEHVDAKFVKNVLQSFDKCRVVALTHGLPGQPGHHHVNLQWPIYWQHELFLLGYTQDIIGSYASRTKAHSYWAATGMIFVKESYD
jgi:hypothetical protein